MITDEWTIIKVINNIPDPETWDQYEWRGDVYMLLSNQIFKPTDICVSKDGDITAYEDLDEYCMVAYRPKPSGEVNNG